jgi:hypothetical protein
MSEEINPSPIIEVKNFDVLAEERTAGCFVLLENQIDQIGNNRFKVLIDMYENSYNTNYSDNNHEECDKIIGTIMDITCLKHTDNSTNHNNDTCGRDQSSDCNKRRGRFIVKTVPSSSSSSNDSNDSNTVDCEWRELNEKDSELLIRQTFKSRTEEVTEEEEIFEPMSINYNSNSNSNSNSNNDNELNERSMNETRQPSLRRSQSASNLIADTRALYDWVKEETEDEEDIFEPMPMYAASMDFRLISDFPSIIDGGNTTQRDDNKKRGRRSSLLRRSNSFDSGLTLDKKKTFKNSVSSSFMKRAMKFGITKIKSGASSRNIGKGEIVPTHQGMDIVFASDCKTLSTKSTIVGNNRLDVMLTIEKERFLRLSPVEQKNVTIDLVKTVTEFWKGQVLIENGGFAYGKLSHDEAVDAMNSLLLGETGENSSSFPSPSTMGLASSTSTGSASTMTSRTLLSSVPPLPDFLRNASHEILNSSRKSNEITPQERQSTAVKIMKERKKKTQERKEKEAKEKEMKSVKE